MVHLRRVRARLAEEQRAHVLLPLARLDHPLLEHNELSAQGRELGAQPRAHLRCERRRLGDNLLLLLLLALSLLALLARLRVARPFGLDRSIAGRGLQLSRSTRLASRRI